MSSNVLTKFRSILNILFHAHEKKELFLLKINTFRWRTIVLSYIICLKSLVIYVYVFLANLRWQFVIRSMVWGVIRVSQIEIHKYTHTHRYMYISHTTWSVSGDFIYLASLIKAIMYGNLNFNLPSHYKTYCMYE